MENLSYQYIDATPLDVDWSDSGTEWEIIYPSEHTMSNTELLSHATQYGIDIDIDSDTLFSDVVQLQIEYGEFDPVMNSFIPLETIGLTNGQDAANAFYDSCFTVIAYGDEVGLALTGGGTDMSWDMVRAFIKAGYYPPAFVSLLPAISGETDQIAIDAANATLQAILERSQYAIEHNNRLLD